MIQSSSGLLYSRGRAVALRWAEDDTLEAGDATISEPSDGQRSTKYEGYLAGENGQRSVAALLCNNNAFIAEGQQSSEELLMPK